MSDNMSDKMDQYFEAYYGTPIPASKVNAIQGTLHRYGDILFKHGYPKPYSVRQQDAVKAGLLEASALHAVNR